MPDIEVLAPKAATAAVTRVPSSASNVANALAANPNRLGATIYNESTAICYVKFGAVAATNDYTVQIAAGGYFELPPAPIYTGRIDLIWSAANGAAQITELSP